MAVVGAAHAVKGEVPVAFVVLYTVTDASPCSSLELFRMSARRDIGSHAEPDVVYVRELPRTSTGKVMRSLLRAVVSSGHVLAEPDAARSVANIEAYSSCVAAAHAWRRVNATCPVPILQESMWTELEFDCHIVADAALVPATGWLELLRRGFNYTVVEDVQFQREGRDRTKTYFSRNDGDGRIHIVTARALEGFVRDKNGRGEIDGMDYVSAFFSESYDAASGRRSCIDTSGWNYEDVVDDVDATAHYRRCRAVGLQYSGAFRCVSRVVWRTDFAFRAHIVVPMLTPAHFAAILDAGLQIVCSLDALGSGVAYIPYSIQRAEFQDVKDNRLEAIAAGEIVARTDTTVTVNLVFFDTNVDDVEIDELLGILSPQRKFATMHSVSLIQYERTRRRRPWLTQMLSSNPDGQKSEPSVMSCRRKPSASPAIEHWHQEFDLCEAITKIAESVTGGSVDSSKSLLENGLHSLRGVELVSKLNSEYGVVMDGSATNGVHTFRDLVLAVQQKLKDRSSKPFSRVDDIHDRFDHVDINALNRIVHARIQGKDALRALRADLHCYTFTQAPMLHEAWRALLYMMRRGFLHYLRIQYRDGLAHFLVTPPTMVNLELEVIVPGSSVDFHQTDYNRHFTVREIIRDSERGFYNLVHASGLAHLEHYFCVMFFASRLEARFDVELLEGEPYDMHVTVVGITGPLIDIDVAFHRTRRSDGRRNERAFIVTWRLMLVVDTAGKRIYDFERGGVATSDTHQSDPNGNVGAMADHGKQSCVELTNTLTNHVYPAPLSVVLAVIPISAALIVASKTTRIVLERISCATTSPFEVFVVVSAITLWIRISTRPETCDGPIEALLPHG